VCTRLGASNRQADAHAIGKPREIAFPNAWVQCGRFRGADRSDTFDQVDIRSHLPQAIEGTMAFLTKHAFLTAEFDNPPYRRDVYSIPMGAIREVVTNALVHSDYSEPRDRIRVAFYDERTEVDSVGGLLPGMTVASMRSGVSLPRNPVIARVSREPDLLEEWGSGVRDVYRILAEAGLGEPTIVELPGTLRFTIPIKNHRPAFGPEHGTTRTSRAGAPPIPKRDQVGDQVTPSSGQVRGQVRGQVTAPGGQVGPLAFSPQSIEALRALGAGPLSRAEVFAALGLSNKHASHVRHVVPLVGAGLVERTAPDQPRSRSQRYRLTDAGRAALAQLDGPAE
jgi:predicted HTH transcriptional regulator